MKNIRYFVIYGSTEFIKHTPVRHTLKEAQIDYNKIKKYGKSLVKETVKVIEECQLEVIKQKGLNNE